MNIQLQVLKALPEDKVTKIKIYKDSEGNIISYQATHYKEDVEYTTVFDSNGEIDGASVKSEDLENIVIEEDVEEKIEEPETKEDEPEVEDTEETIETEEEPPKEDPEEETKEEEIAEEEIDETVQTEPKEDQTTKTVEEEPQKETTIQEDLDSPDIESDEESENPEIIPEEDIPEHILMQAEVEGVSPIWLMNLELEDKHY